MGYLSGNSGHILFGSSAEVDTDVSPERGWIQSDTKVTNWTLNTSAQLLDTTTLGDYDKSSVYGIRTSSGTLRLFYYTPQSASNGNPSNNSASWFINALTRAADESNASSLPPGEYEEESIPVRLRLYVDNRRQTDDYIEFDANISSVAYGSNVGELVALDVNFEATGQIRRSRI